jgi:transcriptional regulator with XRE-family HTH domain
MQENGVMKKDEILQTFADNLAQGMAERGLTQTALQIKSGVAQTHISRLLLCKNSATLETVAALAQALDMQPWELLVDDEATRRSILARMIGAETEPKIAQHKRRRKRE